ncbi:MAG: prepilin-type N-terminal cleavage/methylation domain-containing protein [Candidatus Omnitrophica bacterium]|nr:prepilin-type N-terminal cleavage/methylation domain-containing protein [Candidatus Omnitrophota bacterium]
MKRRRAAFTLVEVLIGMSMFAVIAASVYASLYLGIKVWRQQERAEAQLQAGLRAAELIAGILRNTYVNSRHDEVVFSGMPEEVNFFTVTAAGDVEEIRLYLEPAAGQPSAGLYMQRRLLRELENEEDSPAEPVALQVKKFSWRYYDAVAGRWQDRWDTSPAPPAQVAFALSLPGQSPEAPDIVLEKFVYIPAAASAAVPAETPPAPDSAAVPAAPASPGGTQ